MALPVLHRAGEGQGLHRVHRPRELRGGDDQGEMLPPARAFIRLFTTNAPHASHEFCLGHCNAILPPILDFLPDLIGGVLCDLWKIFASKYPFKNVHLSSSLTVNCFPKRSPSINSSGYNGIFEGIFVFCLNKSITSEL